MTGSVHALASVAQQVPGYCTSGHGILTPQQWQTCWKLGWNLPTTTPAAQASGAAGSVVFLIVAVATVLFLLSRFGSRRAATSS